MYVKSVRAKIDREVSLLSYTNNTSLVFNLVLGFEGELNLNHSLMVTGGNSHSDTQYTLNSLKGDCEL